MAEQKHKKYNLVKQESLARVKNKRRRNKDNEEQKYQGKNWMKFSNGQENIKLYKSFEYVYVLILIFLCLLLVYFAETYSFLGQSVDALKHSPSLIVLIVAYIILQEKTIKYGYLLWFDEKAHYLKEPRFWKAGILFSINFVSSAGIIASLVMSYVDMHLKINYDNGKFLSFVIGLLLIICPLILESLLTWWAIKWSAKNDPDIITY